MRYREPFSLYRRVNPSGNIVYYYQTYSPDGRRTTAKSTGLTNRAAARSFCLKLWKENQLIQKVDPLKIPTFQTFAQNFWIIGKSEYLKYREQRGFPMSRSYAFNQDKQLQKYLIPAWGKKLLDQITAPQIETWFLGLKDDGLSHQTCNHLLSNLRTILGEAQRRGIVLANPAEAIKPLSKAAKTRGILAVEEVKKLLSPSTWSLYWSDWSLYIANLLSASTGMRMGEVQALRWCDFQPSENPDRIVVTHSWDRKYGLKGTKTNKDRIIPLTPELCRLIMRGCPELGAESFVTPNPTGEKPIYERCLTDSLYEALEKVGVSEAERKERNITFHSWRHFFNTFLRRQGIQDSKVQMVTGHSSVEMTDHYTHFDLSDLKEIQDAQLDLLVPDSQQEINEQKQMKHELQKPVFKLPIKRL